METPINTRYSPRASFVCILREQEGIIEVCVTPTITQDGSSMSRYKLVGGTAEELEDAVSDGYFESHRDTAYREVSEETGGGILLGKIKEAFTAVSGPNFPRPHSRRFYLALGWSGRIEAPLENEDAPARWMSISAFRRNALPNHIEGFFACLDLGCKNNPEFLELIRRQEGFEDYEPQPAKKGS